MDSHTSHIWADGYTGDEQHIAAAIYLLHKALALRANPESAFPEIHGCLRDAAEQCEAARLHWTKERQDQIQEIASQIFSMNTGHPAA